MIIQNLKMKTEKAHQIANPEIIIRVKELKKLKKNGVSDTSFSVIEKKEFIRGILIAQEKEIEFLEQMVEYWEDEDSDLWQPVLGHMKKRLEALKISCQDLRRVLK